MPKLLSTAYFPPVSYFAAIAQEMEGLGNRQDGDSSIELSPSVVYIEACENYQKQSYRNRCHIYASGGLMPLSFPIIHEGGSHKHPIGQVKVDYSRPWVSQHKKAIVSAYGMSAYFEYYQDELFDILDSRPEKLLDLNMAILRFFISKTGLLADLRLTEEYTCGKALVQADGSSLVCDDLRDVIHPKRPNSILADNHLEKPYFQVFSQKYGFISDLSIMDLLFNEGPDSILYLKKL
ncbi:MAG: WbqC family protein [Bacteroidales bacterium]|nr:WbqC family protein [Bacteroidales bacterium]